MPTPALPHRVRHYVTLGVQVILFAAFASTLLEGFRLRLLAIALICAAGCLGPVLELQGNPLGRRLTLAITGLQALTTLGLFVAILLSGGPEVRIRLEDAWAFAVVFAPALLFGWNYLGGRRAAASAPLAAS